ncbi:MAG: sigma-70 family RNA polymerase sigma factor [Candidatus Komeilibacteria bacterium]
MSDLEKQFIAGYEAYSDAIFRHCYFRVGDRGEAFDLMQETFTRTWDYLAGGKSIDNLRAWLYRVATNLIIDRSRKHQESSLDQLMDQGFQPMSNHYEKLTSSIDAKAILVILDKLEAGHRQVIIWRYVEDLRPKDIAQLTGESENVISVRLNRALKQLRQLLYE